MFTWNTRKRSLLIERINHDGGPSVDPALRKGAVGLIVGNPFCHRFAETDELIVAMDALRPIANEMAEELCSALGGMSEIETFGKGSVVGTSGELEHAAIWHAPGGAAVRNVLGGAKAQVPAAKKMGNLGAVLDIPLHYVHASMVRSHYDVMPFSVADAPKPDELLFILTMSTGGRVHSRIGGLTKDEVKKDNGLC